MQQEGQASVGDSGKQTEEAGIAVLLTGDSADLFASLHAIELAKRTGKIVHAVILGRDKGLASGGAGGKNVQDPILLAAWLGQAEGLQIRWHTLLDATDEELLAFFRTHRIFCLIAGARSKTAMQRKTRWLEELRGKLLNDAHWYPSAFWVLVTEPWDNEMFDRVVQQLSSRESGTTEMA